MVMVAFVARVVLCELSLYVTLGMSIDPKQKPWLALSLFDFSLGIGWQDHHRLIDHHVNPSAC
jgi:hypothetical protein